MQVVKTDRRKGRGGILPVKFCFISSMFGTPWAGSELLWGKTAFAALNESHEVACVFKSWEKMPATLLELQARGATLFLRRVNLGRRSSRIFERLVVLSPTSCDGDPM